MLSRIDVRNTFLVRVASAAFVLLALTAPFKARAELLAYYSFDVDTRDDSGNGYDGDFEFGGFAVAEPTHVEEGGYEAGAYEFDRVGRIVVDLDLSASVLPQLTLGAWVQTATLEDGIYYFIGCDNGGADRAVGLDTRGTPIDEERGLRYTAQGGGSPLWHPTSVADFGPSSTENWAFVAASWDAATGEGAVYADLDASTVIDALAVFTGPESTGDCLPSFSIGAQRPDREAIDWLGRVDNVFVFDEVLSPERLRVIRNFGSEALLLGGEAPDDIFVATFELPVGLR